MNDDISVHWLKESEITFRNEIRRNWLLSSTGKWLEENSQDTTHWNLGETHSHRISHAAVGTGSIGTKLSGRATGDTGSLTWWPPLYGAAVLHPWWAQMGSREHPWHGAGGREAVMLCHPSLRGPLCAYQLEKSVSASQTLGTPNSWCFREATKSITTAPLKYKDCHCNTF